MHSSGVGRDRKPCLARSTIVVLLVLLLAAPAAHALPAPEASSAAPEAAGTTRIGGRLFFDLERIDAGPRGAGSARPGTAFDVRRFSLALDHAFGRGWSLDLTTDYSNVQGMDAAGPYVKKAYLQYAPSDALVLRAGSAELPWVPFAEAAYGMRYVENTLVDRLRFGTSADWGVHAGGKLADGRLEYAVAALNGKGYRNPARSDGVDFEGRIGFAPTPATVVGIGAYSGTLGRDAANAGAQHTARRIDFIAAYVSGSHRLGVEYFSAENWNNLATLAPDAASGWSAWGSRGLTRGGITLFARYDHARPARTLDPTLQDTYYNLGIEFPFAQVAKLAAVFKRTDRHDAARSIDLQADELGVWGEFRF